MEESGVRDPTRCSNTWFWLNTHSAWLKPRDAAGGSQGLIALQRAFPITGMHRANPKALPTCHEAFCRDLSLALRMLARIEESSHKLFLRREGALPGAGPRRSAPGSTVA